MHTPRSRERRTPRLSPASAVITGLCGCLLAVTAAWSDEQTNTDQTPGNPSEQRPSSQRQIDELRRQLEAVQKQLQRLADQNQQLLEHQRQLEREIAEGRQVAGRAPAPSSAAQAAPPSAPTAQAATESALPGSGAAPQTAQQSALPSTQPGTSTSGVSAALANIRLWGYGEVYFAYPLEDHQRAQADLARAVFGIGYQFDDRTEFNSEYEVEHAVASATDVGEFEVEQFYVDRRITDAFSVRGGLLLMPFGLLNEHHEPTNFYGMQRNFVGTLIIPSTWREGGLSFFGDTGAGFGWNAGVTTGFDLSKWSYQYEFPPYITALELEDSDIAPLQATHQELALANAQHPSGYVSLSYFGTPGLLLGAAIFSGDAVKVPAPPNAPIYGDQRVTLWEGHARWTPGRFDLSALYARGSISNLAAANAANPGSPNPIPSSFYGYFVQAAYNLWQHDEFQLFPFVRWELYDMGASYQGTTGPVVPSGFVPVSAAPGDYGYWPINHDRVWTTGFNFYVTPHVVIKADYQHFEINRDFTRVDLGLGLAF